jgi:hypothetical protein
MGAGDFGYRSSTDHQPTSRVPASAAAAKRSPCRAGLAHHHQQNGKMQAEA